MDNTRYKYRGGRLMKTVQMKKYWRKTTLTLALMSAASLGGMVNAYAVPLASGASQNLSGTTVAARPELAGTVLIDRVRPFSMLNSSGAKISGTFQDRVVRRTSTGTLEFSFRIKN